MKKLKVVSGMRPTGRLHLGNYWGALGNWVAIQENYDCMFFVADWHALTTAHEDSERIKSASLDMAADWLAAGLDPKKSVIFRQSSVPEIAELSLLLGMITPLGWLLRCPTYKEQLIELFHEKYAGQEKNLSHETGKLMGALAGAAGLAESEIAAVSELSSLGFLAYPVLMAADILAHRGEAVPVGQDQLAHLEITRDIARRFADIYGEAVFPEPKPLLSETIKVPGLDGRKMSKSYGNAIDMGEDEKSAEKKVMSMFTDPAKKRADDKGNPDGCVVFAFHKIYNPAFAAREKECRDGAIGCVKCKKEFFSLLAPKLAEFRQKRALFSGDAGQLEKILNEGSAQARESAARTLCEVRRAMKLS